MVERNTIYAAFFFVICLLLIFSTENEKTTEIESFYHEPWRAGKNITENDFIFENDICDPISMPPKWLNSKPWNIGFRRQPDCPKVKLLILVESAPNHFEHRKVLRQFFRKKNRDDMALFFVLGRSDVELIDEIEDDFIIGDFDDTYSNLPSKTKVAYEYFADCPEPPEFMIMQDDDTVADIEPIIKTLDAQKAKKNERAVYGALHPKVPIMNSWMRSRGLWVGKASWPYNNWPTYISGPCTFMDKEAALAIAEAATTALEVFNVPIEDALFTGILRVKGCVEARNAASMCHHLTSDVQKLKQLTGFHENDAVDS